MSSRYFSRTIEHLEDLIEPGVYSYPKYRTSLLSLQTYVC